MTLEEELAAYSKHLAAAYEVVRKTLEKEYPDVDPLEIRDTQGRFVLYDGLVSLVNADTALLRRT